jgi:predicted DNA-binding transcriptional regulator AlpA
MYCYAFLAFATIRIVLEKGGFEMDATATTIAAQDAPETRFRRPLLSGFVSERDFADQIGKSLRTVREWRKQGRGPRTVKLGNLVFYRRSAIENWLREIEVDPAQPQRRRARR